jgi:hypothetical protein
METRDRLKYLSVNVKVIINKMGYVRVDWHHAARDSVQQQVLVHVVMHLWDA